MVTGKALGKAGDATANQFLVHALRQQRAQDGLLSEEEKDNFERLDQSRVWIVDPVDGTREYGEARADWAVHVGLAVDGAPVLGAVALPGADAVYRSDAPVAVPPHPTCCAWWSAAPAPPPRPCSWPVNWAPNWSPWAARARKPWP
jgi:3'(2'), 5'-bisphosphate nucleotidase